MSRRPVVRVLADLALSVAAVLGAVGVVVVLLGSTLGVRPLLFRSGSMSPTIRTGDLALSRPVPASALRVGDIVSVLDASGHRVTHRVVAVEGARETRQLRLRGDANRSADSTPYVVARADRVVLVVHGLGWLVAGATGPVGRFALGLYVAGMLALALRGPRSRGAAPKRRARRPRSVRRPAVTAVALAAGAAVVPAAAAEAAPWTDQVPVAGQALATTMVPATSLSCGALGVLSVTFTWTAVPGATSYTLHYGTGGTWATYSTSSTSATLVSAITGGTAWVEVNRAFGAVTWTSAPSNSRTYTVAAVSLCG